MIRRTVLRIEPDGPGGAARRLKVEEIGADDFQDYYGLPFNFQALQLPDWAASQAGLLYGQALLTGLEAAHAGVKKALDITLQAADGEVRPIYFYLDTADAELFCWESLCNAGNFLALAPKWPIGRIAQSVVSPSGNTHDFAPPLRLLAVISALGPTEQHKAWDQDEWQRLYQVVQNQRQHNLPIKVQVVVGQEELLTQVSNLHDPDLEVQTVPKTSFQLRQLIENFHPHLVHFFCHGNNDNNLPRLEFARISDWDEEDPTKRTSSIQLHLSDFQQSDGLDNLWLVTLNCCEGSKASKTDPSLTRALVARGLPAAVGMLEAIEPADAHEFCEAFYNTLLANLRETFARGLQNNKIESIEWVVALQDCRNALKALGRNARNNQPAWTLPAIYVRRDPFQVRVLPGPAPSPTAAFQAAPVTGLLELLAPLAADSPEAARFREELRKLLPPAAPGPAPAAAGS